VPKITLTRNEAFELLDDPNSGLIQDTIVDTARWSIVHKIIVKIGDKLYQSRYSVGATECQEERPWEWDKTVDFFEVEEYQKTVTDYRLVKDVS
jgi:hypothetical protein